VVGEVVGGHVDWNPLVQECRVRLQNNWRNHEWCLRL
jgi:hypothetical protein